MSSPRSAGRHRKTAGPFVVKHDNRTCGSRLARLFAVALIPVALVSVVTVTVMKIVDVIAVLDRFVAAVLAVNVRMVFMDMASHFQ